MAEKSSTSKGLCSSLQSERKRSGALELWRKKPSVSGEAHQAGVYKCRRKGNIHDRIAQRKSRREEGKDRQGEGHEGTGEKIEEMDLPIRPRQPATAVRKGGTETRQVEEGRGRDWGKRLVQKEKNLKGGDDIEG